MSGFVGIVAADGAPVDRALLERMTRALAFRGPDGQGTWSEGGAGLGHTLLRTVDESAAERQPATLDGEVWIVSDARIDRREDLARELGLRREVLSGPDCFLILHAYARWGERCVEHLMGDFAFAVWDGRERKLFCARDHFGVKPFHYAAPPGGLVVGNTLNGIRLHPGVSDRLNELAIADFLLYYHNQDVATTTFADISRLPPAHRMTWSDGRLRVERYWSLPSDPPARFTRTRDCVDGFGAALEAAVADRLRQRRVAIFLSGGLDSTAVAATARRVAPTVELRGCTAVWNNVIEDSEGEYAKVVADYLEIPEDLVEGDRNGLFEGREVYATPEPEYDPQRLHTLIFWRGIGRHARVALTGHGGDPIFTLRDTVHWALLRRVPPGQLLGGLLAYTLDQRRIPRFCLRGTLRRLAGRGPKPPAFPEFLRPALVEKLDLRARHAAIEGPKLPAHPWRPAVARILTNPLWSAYFESIDPGRTGELVEARHPLFSRPVVDYMMSVPDVPYCVDKFLLRMHAKGLLPEQIRRRPKTPMSADPCLVLMRQTQYRQSGEFELSHPMLAEFVDVAALKSMPAASGDADYAYARAFNLNLWLEHAFR